jgi:GntR family transcriptional regulator
MADQIDYDSPVPYYSQLKQILLEKIHQEVWKVGEALPTQIELCDQYGVSKAVVRQALKSLEDEGRITQRRGKVACVAEPKISGRLLQNLSGTFQDMIELGYYPTTKIIKNHLVPANPKVAQRMGIPEGTQVIELERLRFIKEEPFVIIVSYLPYTLCPEILHVDLTGKSLLEELKNQYGIVLTSSKRSIEAVIATEYEAKLLNVKKGAPLLLFTSASLMRGGEPVGTTEALFRGDRAKFDVEVGQINDIE